MTKLKIKFSLKGREYLENRRNTFRDMEVDSFVIFPLSCLPPWGNPFTCTRINQRAVWGITKATIETQTYLSKSYLFLFKTLMNDLFFSNKGHPAISFSILLAVVILLMCHVMQELSMQVFILAALSVYCIISITLFKNCLYYNVYI